MERREKRLERDNGDLAKIVDLMLDPEFNGAVTGLTEGWVGHSNTLADTFADLAKKHGASSDVMKSAIEMIQVQGDDTGRVQNENVE